MKLHATIAGTPVYTYEDGSVEYMGELTVDGDGAPKCYHPAGSPPGLDYLANAGKPGNWWGLAVNGKGKPIVQTIADPAPGFYVSTTAYKVPGYRHGDPRRELNSEQVSFIVVPSTLWKSLPGIVLGCKALVIDTLTGKSISAVVGDIGPANHLGEASIAAARALGLNADPKRGGSSQKRFKYLFWPGIPAEGFRLQGKPAPAALAAISAVEDVVYVS